MPRGDVRIPVVPAIRGFRSDLPRHLISDEYLADGQNVIIRDGTVMVRFGVAKLSAAPTANRVMGGIYYKDNVQTEHVVIGTTASLHHFDGSSWTTITGSALNGTSNDQVRFVAFPFSTTTRLVAVNDVDAPQSWTGSGNFAALGGSPPIAKCATASFQRLILGNVTVSGTRRGSSIWISDFQNPAVWPSVNQVDLPDTGDVIVEIRALNNQAFAIYKERSQWIGVGAANIFPFVFQLQSQQPGPVSPAAVVQVESVHYYLAFDGCIYRFDGSHAVQIASRVRQSIRADVDAGSFAQAHGVFDPSNREIWWFWPSLNNPTGFGGITYRLPYDDIQDAFSPLHSYTTKITASFPWRFQTSLTWAPGLNGYSAWTDTTFTATYPTWQSFGSSAQLAILTGGSTGDVYRFGLSGSDDGSAISAYWDNPFRPLAGIGENVRLDVIESYFKQTATAVSADIIAVTSDTLADPGTAQPITTVNLSTGGRLRATYYNLQARFAYIRHRILQAVGGTEYRGSTIFCYKREEQ